MIKTQETITNEQLIHYVHNDLANSYLSEKIADWRQTRKWHETILELAEPIRFTYCIEIFNVQVMIGGFQQYFDNAYGIIVEETLKGLQVIGAERTFELLNNTIEILRNHCDRQNDLFDLISNSRSWENKEIEDILDWASNEYWNLQELENLTELLGKYLRKYIID